MDVHVVAQCLACSEAYREDRPHDCPITAPYRLGVTASDESHVSLPMIATRKAKIAIKACGVHRVYVGHADTGTLQCIEPGDTAYFEVRGAYNPRGHAFPPVYSWFNADVAEDLPGISDDAVEFSRQEAVAHLRGLATALERGNIRAFTTEWDGTANYPTSSIQNAELAPYIKADFEPNATQMGSDEGETVKIFHTVEGAEDFYDWAQRCVDEAQTEQLRFATAPVGTLPLSKGQSVPKMRLELGDKVYILTNVMCVRGLEQGLVEYEGDVDSVIVTACELVEIEE